MYALFQYNGTYDALINSLDKRQRARIKQRLERLQSFGARAGPKVVKPLRDGIFECRAQSDRQQIRVLWFYLKGKKIVIGAGMIKKGGEVPPAEIDKVIEIKKLLETNPEKLDELTKVS